MLRTLKDLQNFSLRTQDGATAAIKDFIVDDFNWLVRYIIAQVGDRQVALSTTVFNDFDDNQQTITTRLNEAAILDGPVLDLDHPLTRQDEEMLSQHYGWSPYWQSQQETDLPYSIPGDLTSIPMLEMQADLEREQERLVPVSAGEGKATRLRRASEMMGYSINARGEDAGKLTDILIQSSDWNLHYLVVDTGGMLANKQVILSPQWVQAIDSEGSRIQVDLDKETLYKSTELNDM